MYLDYHFQNLRKQYNLPMKTPQKGRMLAIMAIFFSAMTFGQGSFPVLEWSPEYNVRNAKFDRLLQVGDNGFYTYRGSAMSLIAGNRDEYFAYYNRYDLSEQWLMKNPRWEWNGRRVDFKTSLIIGDLQYLFYESYDRTADIRYLLCRTLDAEANLGEIKVLEVLDSRFRNRGEFDVQLSKDRSKIAIFTNPPYERQKAENFYVRVFDPSLNELWNADVELVYQDRNFGIMDFEVSNAGDVFILSYFDRSPNLTFTNNRDLDYKLMKIGSGEENEIIEFDLGLQNVRVHSLGIECDITDGEMAISGFYGRRNSWDMDGALYLAFDQIAGEVVHSNLNPFSTEFVAQFSKLRAKRGRGIRKNFVFRQFVSRPDGGAYVVAEDYELIVRTVQTGRGTTTTNYYYYYRDIIVLSINKEGDVDWYAHIPKEQNSMNDGGYYLGYTFLMNEDGLHFVYNDHRGNVKRWGKKRLRPIRNAKAGNLVMVTLGHDASLNYRVLNKNKRQKFRVAPRSSRLANDGKDGAILLSLRGSKIRFGNLRFEE